MKRYPKYKDSGIDWLGEIPEHWDYKKLKYIAKIVLGKMLKSTSSDNDYLKPYLRSANIQWDKVDVSDMKQMWFTKEEMNSYLVKQKDILVSEGGEVGRACVWNNEIEECYIQNSVHKITCAQEAHPSYIYYLFYAIARKGYFESIVNRVSIAHLTREKLINIGFIVPPLEEQKTIACFIDRKLVQIDQFIRNKQRFIELLKEQKSAIVNRAVTKGLNPDAPMKPSGIEWLGDIPEGWEVKRLKFFTKFVTSGSRGWAQYYSDDGSIFLRIGNLSGTSIDLKLHNLQFVKPPQGTEGERTRVFPNDLLISITALIGAVGIVPNDIGEAFVNQHIALVRLLKNKIYPRWAAYCIHSVVVQNQFITLVNGGTKEGLTLDDVKNLLILIPSLDEQLRLVNYIDANLSKINQAIAKAEKEIELIQEYRTTLISDAVTGKIDVREITTTV